MRSLINKRTRWTKNTRPVASANPAPQPDGTINTVKHTPSPWNVTNLETAETVFYIGGQSGSIASAWNKGGGEGEANARLIAAAPELLAALEDLVAISKYPYKEMATYKYAQEIIKKAKG